MYLRRHVGGGKSNKYLHVSPWNCKCVRVVAVLIVDALVCTITICLCVTTSYSHIVTCTPLNIYIMYIEYNICNYSTGWKLL